MATFEWPNSGGGGGVEIYNTFASFPASATTGTLAVAADTGILYEYNGAAWFPIASNASYTGGTNAITSLINDVTATGPGAASATVQAIQGKTVSGTTGTVNLVFSNSPTLENPALGTPASGLLTNCTGLLLNTGTTGQLLLTNGGIYPLGSNMQILTIVDGSAVWAAPATSGTVTSVSVVSGSGFAGTVANPTTTPAISLSTTITGILQGDGTAISAASTTGSGAVVLATSPTLVNADLGTPSSATLTNATGLPLTTGVTGVLPIANGGTNNGSLAVTAGGVLYTDGTKVVNVGAGTSSQYLTGGTTPTWTSASSGTVTSVTFTGDGVVLSSTPSSAVTTSGTVTATLNTQSAGTFLAGPTSGSAAAPTFRALLPPTQQRFTSGSGTYTLPAGVLYLKVRMVGGGGGGAGGGTSGGDGTAGNQSLFGTSLLVANGGSAGLGRPSNSNGASGGTASISSPAYGTAVSGGGSSGAFLSAVVGSYPAGTAGGSSVFGGAGASGGEATAGSNAATNSGSGGGGGGADNYSGTLQAPGTGGGAGGFVDAIVPSPSSTYSYTVAASAAGGTSNHNGGDGAAGYIEVTEYYQ